MAANTASSKPADHVNTVHRNEAETRIFHAKNSKRIVLTEFFLFLVVCLISAFTNQIWDCDESMNYYEPLHQILFKYGLQTWEYSPVYGLRSYFYISIHSLFTYAVTGLEQLLIFISDFTELPIAFMEIPKYYYFYSVRIGLGLTAALSFTYLYSAVRKRYGQTTASFLAMFLIVSPGTFTASTTFLPSTFAMYAFNVMLAAWIDGDLTLAQMMVALSFFIAWPFSILVGLPLAIYIIINKGIASALVNGMISVIWFVIPSMLVDYHYYNGWIFAPMNIIIYNVFSNTHGPELYGIEPWYYYIINGFLNFNIILLLAFVSIPFVVIHAWTSSKLSATLIPIWHLSGGVLWFIYMSYVPHKEERFLYVIYGFICFAAALAMASIVHILQFVRTPKPLIRLFSATILLAILALSVSRLSALNINYNAPIQLYTHLYHKETAEKILEHGVFLPNGFDSTSLVCLGKEWHRFATHFFLPSHMRVGFIPDGFHGQLPQYFGDGPDATSRIPPNFNDANQEELSRYVSSLDECKYLVTFLEDDGELYKWEQQNGSDWHIHLDLPFLNAAKSRSRLYRAFYVPTFSEKHNIFGHYVLMERKTARTS